MADDRGEARSRPDIPAADDKRPSGLPPAESTARRVSDPGARRDGEAPVTRLRPPRRDREAPRGDSGTDGAPATATSDAATSEDGDAGATEDGGAASSEDGGATTSKDGDAATSETSGATSAKTTDAATSETTDAASSETTDAATSETTDAATSEDGGAASAKTRDAASSETRDAASSETTDAGPTRTSDTKTGEEPGSGEPSGAGAGASSRPSKRPVGLGGNMTKSARLRLQLALDEDDDDEDERRTSRRPVGLKNMTTSARHRLQLALDEDIDELEAIKPPRLPSSNGMVAFGHIPFDAEGRKIVRSLMRWVAFCGLLTLTVGALTGLSYLTGPGSVAHVVVGILASALSVWLLAAAWSFRRVLTDKRQQHHLINGFGLLRSALLLKAILLFSAMVLGCFTFSIATALVFLL